MSGKGDKPRQVNMDVYRANYDRIFGGKQKSIQDNPEDAGAAPATSTFVKDSENCNCEVEKAPIS